MNIRKGDAVQIVFTEEVGVVIDYIDALTVLLDLDGDEIPVYLEHVKKVETNKVAKSKAFVETYKSPQKRAKIVEKNRQKAGNAAKEMGFNAKPDELPDRGLQFLMQPFYNEDLTIKYFLLHLNNSSGKSLKFDYKMLLDEKVEFTLTKNINRRGCMILNSIEYEQLNDKPKFYFRIYLPKQEKGKPAFFERTVSPKNRMLRKSPDDVLKINGRAYTYPIVNSVNKQLGIVDERIKEAEKNKPVRLTKKDLLKIKHSMYEKEFVEQKKGDIQKVVTINAELRVIDLHIEKLLKSYRHLRSGEILRTQLQHFEKHLEEAIKREEKSMIAIHGLGKGKLKSEIFKLLRCYAEVKNFKNEYHHLYGFGATEIFFEYKK
ncbi:MAG: Smr/MutS family protein [Chitinophagales bacterium]